MGGRVVVHGESVSAVCCVSCPRFILKYLSHFCLEEQCVTNNWPHITEKLVDGRALSKSVIFFLT